ncbi:MAG TPA: hypothetical protein VEB00_03380 [Clostridia bacterium]|nr:hypothetical protein [Clostridia bacterium]
MNILKHLYRFFVPALIILSLLNFTACSPQKKPEVAQTKAEEEKPPGELDKLKGSIEKVEKALETIHEESKKPMFIQQEKIEKQASGGGKQKEGGQSGGQGGGGSSGGGSSSGGSGGGGGGQGQQQQAQATKLPPEQIKLKLEQEKYKKFEKIKKDVLGLHSAWNSYEAKAISDFAMQTAINDFESALNNLTKTVDTQDVYLSLLEVNQLYKYLPDFYMLYESKVPPDLDRLRFAVKKIQLLSEKKDFTGANDVLQYFENIWMAARPKLKSDNAEIVSKFEFAFADLKNAVIVKNGMIVEAKSEVLLKLVDEIEKKAEKSGK